MPSFLIVNKNGDIKQHSSKNLTQEELYKKAGFKVGEGFKSHANWKIELGNKEYNIHLFGKTTGKANQENKYEFPPPVDNTLFFGSCVLANMVNGELEDLNAEEWEEIYECLFGGFEDLDETASEDESAEELDTDEELRLAKLSKTKAGYAKDGFVVDDDDDDDDDTYYDTMDDSEDSIVIAKETGKKKGKQVASASKAKPEDVYECTSELEEEEYEV